MSVEAVAHDQNPDHRYRPEIDGLRAIAVGAVVLFHAGLGFPGGFVGVDVFFVISGFLVTGIIARAIDQGDFSLGDFYCRRIRRIFPAAAVVTALVLAFGYRSSLPDDYVQISRAAVWQSGFASNVFFWLESGYFSRDVLTKPFLHCWSLAVEEQFYLVFPPVLLCFYWIGRTRRRVVWGVAAIAICSFALSLYGTRVHPSATFYLLPTRGWELMTGALVALTGLRINHRNTAEAVAGFGTVMIAVSLLGLSEDSDFPGYVALLPAIGTALVIIANTNTTTTVGRLLSQPAMVFIGLISYSLYLWHWPLLAFTRYLVQEPSRSTLVATVLASTALAAISWRWVEQPIRRRRILASDRSLLVVSGIVWCGLLIAPLSVVRYAGFPNRFDAPQMALIEDAAWNGNQFSRDVEQIVRDDVPRLGDVAAGGSDAAFLLWGDSHAMTWTDVIDSAATRTGRLGYAALHGGTPPIPGLWRTGMPNCREFNGAVMDWIDRHPIADVILVSRWSVYVDGYSDADPKNDGRSDADVFLSDGPAPSVSGDQSIAAMIRQLARLAEQMKRRQIRLWLVRQVPVQHSLIAESAAQNMLIGGEINPLRATNRNAHRDQQARIEPFYQVAKPLLESTGGGLLDLDPLFFDERGEAIIRVDSRYLYRDDDHLSKSGAARLEEVLTGLLKEQAFDFGWATPAERIESDVE
jgi:peptidoglycan/LPS O-acetylase OafA/YrhL